MPTYEYECASCGNAFEAFQSITAKAIRKCPKCGRKVQRLISGGGGILFKGSGFYATDYRSKEYKSEAKQEKESVAPAKEDSGKQKSSKPKEATAKSKE